MERRCKTCRFWDVHSLDMKKGDCRAPDNHRYWRHTSPRLGITACLDSFGREETKPDYSCGAWQAGQTATESPVITLARGNEE